MAAFAGMMDSLENWAEVLDLENGRKWRNRENTKPLSDENWDDGYYDRPPYYGWVLTNINKLDKSRVFSVNSASVHSDFSVRFLISF